MPVHRHLEANAFPDEAELAAEIAQGIHVDLGVGVDPGNAPAHSHTLGRQWSERGQQPSEGEYRDEYRQPRARAH